MTKVNISEQTRQTLLRHWQAFRAGDVEGIMADYTEDAVLITPDGTLKGREQIRSLFMQVFANMFPPDSTSLSMTKQVVEGEMAYILWSGSSAHYNAPFCTDTFLMREGKIVAQTFAAQLVAK
jgi:ketosteroid isomerase-like protein